MNISLFSCVKEAEKATRMLLWLPLEPVLAVESSWMESAL